MGKYFVLFWKGLFTKDFWAARWGTFLAVCQDAPKFFKDAGKEPWNENAYLLGMTMTFSVIIPTGILFWGMMSFLTGLAGIILLPIFIVCCFLAWVVGAAVLYYVASRLYALAIKWVTGNKPDLNKVRPIVFLCTIGLPLNLLPGVGSLLMVALTIFLLVIAYENALSSTRGQAIGMGLLGMVLNGAFFFLLSLAFGALLTMATIGAGPAFAAWGAMASLHSQKSAPPAVEVIETPVSSNAAINLKETYGFLTKDQQILAASDRLVAALNKQKPRIDWELKRERGVYESMFWVFLLDCPDVITTTGWNVPLAARKLAYDKFKAQEWESWKKIIPPGSMDDFDGGLRDFLMNTKASLTKEAEAVFGPETANAQVADNNAGSEAKAPSGDTAAQARPAVEKRNSAQAVVAKPAVHHSRRVQAEETSPAEEQAAEEAPAPTPVPQENKTDQVLKKAAGNAVKKGLGKAFGF
jgi:hypothetical protein